jgi:transcription antitermination factor NusB
LSEPIKSRRAAREAAFQAVYQCMCGGVSIAAAIEEVLSRKSFAPGAEQLVRDIASGAVTRIDEIDARYSPYLKPGWTPDRLSLIDRLILRIAVFELWFMPTIPPKVTITEAVKLAKAYGSAESSGFINAVLARVLEDSPKKNWDPSTVPAVEQEPETEEDPEEHEPPPDPTPAWIIKSDG